ncbi:MAG: hypothetical protein M1837_006227 [Sclerophora amabilis]|nr:MAG: hypothetical protein M1837_006227 [Sclerophora amabilis]
MDGATPRLLQWPVLRIAPQGRIGVTIFSFLTGYVCAIKPLSQIRAGDPSAALSTVSKSAFRRTPRLLLPATIVTCISWLLCQLGAFKVALRSESEWLRFASPHQGKTLSGAVWALLRNITRTWTRAWNEYDHHQWTLFPLLKGAMMVYVAISATVYMKSRYRMLTTFIIYMYYFLSGEATFGMQFFFGMLLFDFSDHAPAQEFIAKRRWIRTVLPPILISIGLGLASYPNDNPEWAPWSKALFDFHTYFMPDEVDIPRFYSGIGLNFVTLGIQLSPITKDILASKFLLWLGKNSFAIYLIHGTLLRTILAYMVYGITVPSQADIINDKGERVPPPFTPQNGPWVVWASVPIWLGIVYFLAHLWTTYVDATCARLSQRLEGYVFKETEKSSGPLLG